MCLLISYYTMIKPLKHEESFSTNIFICSEKHKVDSDEQGMIVNKHGLEDLNFYNCDSIVKQ